MPRLRWVRAKRPGAAPGALEFVGVQKLDDVRLRLIDFDESEVKESELADISDCFPMRETPTVTWINVDGLHDTDLIERLGEGFGLHPLLLEDIVNTTQRPKFEDFGDYVFIAMKLMSYNKDTHHVHQEHLSIVIGPHWVISFQERVGDVFEPVRNRIRSGKGRIRRMGTDYLAYCLMDAVVDNYFVTLEAIGERLESLDEELMGNPTTETLSSIHRMKRETIILRRTIWPLREVVSGLDRSESKMVKKATAMYIRDLYDHTIQVADTVDTFRDIISGMMDLYLSMVSNRMNEVMKVLTIIATIFIPLTFIAGIYGMNFQNMPELGWHYAYYGVWVVILLVGLTMVLYFRRLRWI
jgi:magnesium transporter